MFDYRVVVGALNHCNKHLAHPLLRMYAYRLGIHQDDRVTVRAQCLGRVEQRRPGIHVVSVQESFHVSSWSRIHSIRPYPRMVSIDTETLLSAVVL